MILGEKIKSLFFRVRVIKPCHKVSGKSKEWFSNEWSNKRTEPILKVPLFFQKEVPTIKKRTTLEGEKTPRLSSGVHFREVSIEKTFIPTPKYKYICYAVAPWCHPLSTLSTV